MSDTPSINLDDLECRAELAEGRHMFVPCASVQALVNAVRAALAVDENRVSNITLRGRQVGVQCDDGEKAYIVHSDHMFKLREALQPFQDTANEK